MKIVWTAKEALLAKKEAEAKKKEADCQKGMDMRKAAMVARSMFHYLVCMCNLYTEVKMYLLINRSI